MRRGLRVRLSTISETNAGHCSGIEVFLGYGVIWKLNKIKKQDLSVVLAEQNFRLTDILKRGVMEFKPGAESKQNPGLVSKATPILVFQEQKEGHTVYGLG